MGIGRNQIAKAGAILGLIVVAIVVVWVGIHAIHENGGEVECAECLARETTAVRGSKRQESRADRGELRTE